MSSIVKASTVLNFSESNDGQIRLEEESRNNSKVPPTVKTESGYSVSCQNVTQVRMYKSPGLTVSVAVGTGTIVHIGNTVETGVQELVTLTLDNQSHELPPWAINIQYALIGSVITPTGPAAKISFNSATRTLSADRPCFAIYRVTYDAPYALYRYTFSGACPVRPPPQFDLQGNAIDPLTLSAVRYFDEGLIYAVDSTYTVSTVLTLDPPECEWGVVGVRFNDSAVEEKLPDMVLEIDPEYPIRFIRAGDNIQLAGSVRVYPRGVIESVEATYGHTAYGGSDAYMAVEEALVFNNTAVQALKSPPVGDLNTTIRRIHGQSDWVAQLNTIATPGQTITDVTWSEDGQSYSNPRARMLNPTEICCVDSFRHPVKILGYVNARYHTSFERIDYYFEWDAENSQFHQAVLIVKGTEGRGASITMSPLSMKSRTRGS